MFAAQPLDVIDLNGKCKAVGECEVVYSGDFAGAMARVLGGQVSWVQQYASGAASSTGVRGLAASTGQYSTLECGPTGLCATTAEIVYWRVRAGAVLCQRTKLGQWMILAADTGVADGEMVKVENGVVTKL